MIAFNLPGTSTAVDKEEFEGGSGEEIATEDHGPYHQGDKEASQGETVAFVGEFRCVCGRDRDPSMRRQLLAFAVKTVHMGVMRDFGDNFHN